MQSCVLLTVHSVLPWKAAKLRSRESLDQTTAGTGCHLVHVVARKESMSIGRLSPGAYFAGQSHHPQYLQRADDQPEQNHAVEVCHKD